jgi:hypothetical protein
MNGFLCLFQFQRECRESFSLFSMQCAAIFESIMSFEWNILLNNLLLNMDYELRSSLVIFIRSSHSNIPVNLKRFKVSLADDQKFTMDVGHNMVITNVNDETFRV